MNLTENSLEQLKALFPNVFAEGKVDFEALKAELGEHVETHGQRYQFAWAGKDQAKRIATTPSLGTLRPAQKESVNWDVTENLYIEGDNLEVLKLLQKSYFSKVRVIYIDPPYNTGKDFVYKDSFKDNLANYQRLTGQRDEEGNPLTNNPDSSGRYHSNWLSMMYPRLKLARNLLRNDGVIFISIDDNEIHNLRKVCDEIFGDGNFIGLICWKNATDNNPTRIAIEHEYVVAYAKNINHCLPVWKSQESDAKDVLVDIGSELNRRGLSDSELQEEYTKWFRENKNFLGKLDRYKYIDKGGVYTGSQSVHNPGKEGYRYDVIHPVTRQSCKEPLMGYRFPEETMKDLIGKGLILYGDDHNKIIELKVYAESYQEKLSSVIELDGRIGAYDLRGLFPENRTVFTNPKPVSFLRHLLSYLLADDDLVLDFFSGSCSSAHAVMEQNAEDGGHRQFIMVQIPELTPEDSEVHKAGYATIAEIGKERIRRAANKIREEHPDTEADLGFKVLKLDSSNIKKWLPDYDNLEQDLLGAVNNILDGRSSEDLLYEVLIKYGLPLTLPVETLQVSGHTVYNVAGGSLVACFDEGIALDAVQAIIGLGTADMPILRIVFRDTSFADDIVKTNAIQRFKQAGINDVLSI
tara:strand:- start:3973 stop:5880 length:1908 start_codon:yes stop_codon:yes gene_type:complete